MYSALDYSVIPLLGDRDPARPKVPAVPWAGYQHRQSSFQEQQDWFREGGYEGLGIVTGRISGLVVLDFDSRNIPLEFQAQHPDLMETRTVLSAGRQLPHLYFRLPPHLSVPSMKGLGVDLLSDGCYVVAPPTSIDGQEYKIIRGGLYTLTERDLKRIQAFVTHSKNRSYSHSLKPLETPRKPSSPVLESLLQKPKATTQDLSRMYTFWCREGGRNSALFRTSLLARDTGWTLQETCNILNSLHIQQAQTGETPIQRQREAISTIESAFSRPARPVPARVHHHTGQLSNSVREALMQAGMTYFIRTYEGLLHKGFKPGQGITAKQAIEQLKGLVGRDSVWNALNAVLNGKRLFALPVSPTYAVATDPNLIESKNAIFEGGKNPEKPLGGRPQHLFRIPTNEELCAILGVKETGSDPLEEADLASASKTRMALHRELIKRRPGSYPLGWLARRLGVNRRTIATYNQLIPIHSREMHIETPLNWGNIARLLPMDEPIQGAVLIGKGGKRYPALRAIAARLLARGEGITLKQQTANFYWFGTEEPFIERIRIQQEVVIGQQRIEMFVAKQQTTARNIPSNPPTTKAVRSKPLSAPNYRRPLKGERLEAHAQQLYNTLNQNGVEGKQLSLNNARRLIVTYGENAVSCALDLLQKRPNVTNHTGFIVTILRSSAKTLEHPFDALKPPRTMV